MKKSSVTGQPVDNRIKHMPVDLEELDDELHMMFVHIRKVEAAITENEEMAKRMEGASGVTSKRFSVLAGGPMAKHHGAPGVAS